jgi:hypothetical protein
MKIRKRGKIVLNKFWDIVCDAFSFIGLTYGIALGKKRANLGARMFFGALAGLTTLGIIALLVVNQSAICTGIVYFIAAVFSRGGDGSYQAKKLDSNLYKSGFYTREYLKETSKFAKWLSVQSDAVQVTVGIVCLAVLVALLAITIKCFSNFVAAVKLSHKKKAERKCKAAKVIPVSRKRAG